MVASKLIDASKLFHIIKYLTVVGLLIFLVPYLNDPRARDAYTDVLRSFQDEKKLFLADFLAHELDGPFEGTELAKLCANRTWFPENKAVILTCEAVPGGLGEVKNGHLSCIRFAIEIGAQLVLPRIYPRSQADITNLHGGQDSRGVALDYMFSVPHLLASLEASCPQMKVYTSLDELYDKPSLLEPMSFWSISELSEETSNLNDTATMIMKEPEKVLYQFMKTLEKRLSGTEKQHWPLRVNVAPSVFIWPALEGGEKLRREFGQLLQTRDDIRALAGSALYNLAKRFNLPLHDFSAAGVDNFTGIHLRTEKDAENFPGFEDQAHYFLNHLQNHTTTTNTNTNTNTDDHDHDHSQGGHHDPHIVYLATGLTNNHQDVRRFRTRAAEFNTTVVLKQDVLDETEVTMLHSQLTWDQRALVDYEVLLRAGHVLGIVESSFAWNVALRRAAVYGKHDPSGFVGRPKPLEKEKDKSKQTDPDKVVMWRDRYSKLFGAAEEAVTLFYGTWP